MRLDGKTIVITGAAGGIGAATAEVLAGLGADLGLIDVNPRVSERAQSIVAMGRRAAAAVCDISNADQAAASIVELENCSDRFTAWSTMPAWSTTSRRSHAWN